MWRTPPAWVIVTRDLVSLVLGVLGIIHEELSGKADLGRLGFFAVLMLAPGVLATVWLAQSGTGAGSSPSLPQEPPASTPSPSSTPTG